MTAIATPPDVAPSVLNEMPAEPTSMGLWTKIAYVQQRVEHVEKTGQVSFGGTSFRHMQEHGLLKVLKPLWGEVGLAVTSRVDSWHMDGNTYVIDFVLVVTDTDTGEQTEALYPNVGVDKADKGINKALTGAHKYALQKFFQVPTEDIDDNETVDQESQRSRRSTSSTPAARRPAGGMDAGELAELRQAAVDAVTRGHVDNTAIKAKIKELCGQPKMEHLSREQADAFSQWLVDAIKAPA